MSGQGNSRVGRPPRKDYASLYPGWPDVDVGVVGDVHDRRLLQLICNVRSAYEEGLASGEVSSLRDVARRVGTSHAVLNKLLSGVGWPSSETVSRLEVVFGKVLWPGLHE